MHLREYRKICGYKSRVFTVSLHERSEFTNDIDKRHVVKDKLTNSHKPI